MIPSIMMLLVILLRMFLMALPQSLGLGGRQLWTKVIHKLHSVDKRLAEQGELEVWERVGEG